MEVRLRKKSFIPSSYSEENDIENDIYDTLCQDRFLMLNRKIIEEIGLELATLIIYLIDKQKYYRDNLLLDSEGYFYSTDMDLALNTGISLNRFGKLKFSAQKREVLLIKRAGLPLKTYYKINLHKVKEIMSSTSSAIELSYKRLLDGKSSEEIITPEELSRKSFRDLRLICKFLKISYAGTDTKDKLISKISTSKNENKDSNDLNIPTSTKSLSLDEVIYTQQELEKLTYSSLRLICKNLKISYKGSYSKAMLIKNILSKKDSEKNSIIQEEKKDKEDIELEQIKKLLLEDFKSLNITWNNLVEDLSKKTINKLGLSNTIEYLKSNYKAIPDNAGLFLALWKKGRRQVNSKDIENFENNKKSLKKEEEKDEISELFSDTRKKFENLDIFEQLKIEEKAIKNYQTTNNLNDSQIENIIKLRYSNPNQYYSILSKYIDKILND